MVPIGAIISAAIGTATAIAGGVKSSKAARKAKAEAEKRRRENQNWYDKEMSVDPTQRADAVQLMTMTKENIRERNRAARGQQAVAGGTEEATAVAKAANNRALSQAASTIAARNVQHKENVRREYADREHELSSRIADLEKARSEAIKGALVGGLAGSASLGSAIDKYVDSGSDAGAQTGAAAEASDATAELDNNDTMTV